MHSKLYKDIVYQTLRLKVRKIEESDFERLHEMQSDPKVMKFILETPQSLQENKQDIQKVMKAYKDEGNGFWVWAIDNEKSLFIGTVALIFEEERSAEIGFRYLPQYWGKGYGTETVEGLVKFSKTLGIINKLTAFADPDNIGSQKVLEKAGFKNHGLKFEEKYNSEDIFYSMTINKLNGAK